MPQAITRRCALHMLGGLGFAAFGFGLAGCSHAESGSAAPAAGDAFKIGILQLTEHAALDAANEGFIQALDDAGLNYSVDQQNAQNDQSACQTIAAKLVNEDNQLILAIATPACQAVAGTTEDIPVLGTAITDYVESGLVDNNEKPGGNVTGTSDLTPIEEQFDLLLKVLPNTKKVGILYCTAESNSTVQAKLAHDAAKARDLEATNFTVATSNEIQQVVESMVGKVDAVYAPTDNTIAAGMQTVSMIATEHKLPVICGDVGMVNNGGLVTYGVDYKKLGYKTGEMAVRILQDGEKPAEMPIERLDESEFILTKNEEIAKALGIDLSVLDK